MQLDLTPGDLETLLTSLAYSKQRVRDSADSTRELRNETLGRLDAVEAKLRAAKKQVG
ncbi:MAG TPA: hypothetical protein VN706_13360 [Gemmatimonadaceae bacterium]|nr:hypothetical protein [Gemmatimonadaceae bacterium]